MEELSGKKNKYLFTLFNYCFLYKGILQWVHPAKNERVEF